MNSTALPQILVTGGEGYIGVHTVRALVQRGFGVVVLDWLNNDGVEHLGVELVVGDIADPSVLAGLFADRKFEAVVHLAALKSVSESFERLGDYFRVNSAGTLNLTEAVVAAAGDQPPAPIVYSSTCAIYGDPDQVPVTEQSAARPANPYAASKFMGEEILRWYSGKGLRSISLRYFNAAGASSDGSIGEGPRNAKSLIPRVMDAALGKTAEVEIYGTDYATPDGTAVRDYVHVEDLAEAHLLALDYLLAGGGSAVVNLGSGRGTSVAEVIAVAERVSGRPVPVRHAPRRPGDAAAIWADNSRAGELLHWSPVRDLDEIIMSAWHWHSRRAERPVGAKRE
ncbi:MAG: UDP-glucose 4-epimerase GalE [Chloroflexota bacterium]